MVKGTIMAYNLECDQHHVKGFYICIGLFRFLFTLPCPLCRHGSYPVQEPAPKELFLPLLSAGGSIYSLEREIQF